MRVRALRREGAQVNTTTQRKRSRIDVILDLIDNVLAECERNNEGSTK